ncbi:MAG: CTP synthase [Meiothermus sp.]|uniref:CTP synthase n=1 Tax=Meiothermus sp. TaxID=1955249 RepID=UPI00260F5823|nr:CTP synthase [Meiothermus sp.]MCS7058513.1 CTP synthase [Meiothermus sp.]
MCLTLLSAGQQGGFVKYIFVTGGVVSSLGKGILTSSLGAILRGRGYRVTAIKVDPYVNVDAGTMRPYEHGEVFVTGDGAETDLDIGHYERFLDIDLSRANNITTGQVYLSVIQKERRGEYLSQTVQVIPHITDEIKDRIRRTAEEQNAEIVVVEVGGTVGDIESLPFLEAIRQFQFDEEDQDLMYIHLTLVPYLPSSGEFKTKPTQHSVSTLRGVGIQPDVLVLRSDKRVPDEVRKKVALFTNVHADEVFSSPTVDYLYEMPLVLEEQGLGRVVEKKLGLTPIPPNLSFWQQAVRKLKQPAREVTVGFVGKYVKMPDAYLSILEAFRHAGIAHDARVNVRWVDAEEITDLAKAAEFLGDVDGVLVGPGFGIRGIEGKILAARYAREQRLPYFGICLGLQVAVIEYARNVLGLEGAHSTEFDPYTPHPVIDLMPEQLETQGLGGTMRLGNWPMRIFPGTLLHRLYGREMVQERHRHRYEVNPAYVERLTQAGLVVSAVTPGLQGRGEGLVEAIELADHPFFIGLQAHPELSSRPMRASPPFSGFIAAALERRREVKGLPEAGLF